MGISARNSDRNIKGVEVSVGRVMNMDPKYYLDDLAGLSQQQDGQGGQAAAEDTARTGEHIYTDEMLSEFDLIEEFELEQEELEDFLNNNPGNIDEDDTLEEVLYKMNEHMMHVLEPLTEFVQNEETMSLYVKEHDHLPFIMKTFTELP